MRDFPKSELNRLRKMYSKGLRVQAQFLWDEKAPPRGTWGTVVGVDSAGTIIVHWDNGAVVGVIYGIDRVRRL